MIGELELGWRMTPNRFVAVTGTNGKTTVAEWLGHVFAEAGMPVAVAGNVGTPLASLPAIDPDATVVCECSSFQLEDSVAFAPEVAVLLNFSPDHLDRHGTLDAYLDAKLRIFASQPPGDGRRSSTSTSRPCTARSFPARGAGSATAIDGCAERRLRAALRRRARSATTTGVLIERSELALAGEHNLRNAMAVAAAALAAGVPRDAVARGLAQLRRRRPSARAGRRDRRRRLRQRLEGDQRRRGAGRARARSGTASTRSSAAASRARGSAGSCPPSRDTAPPAT